MEYVHCFTEYNYYIIWLHCIEYSYIKLFPVCYFEIPLTNITGLHILPEYSLTIEFIILSYSFFIIFLDVFVTAIILWN